MMTEIHIELYFKRIIFYSTHFKSGQDLMDSVVANYLNNALKY